LRYTVASQKVPGDIRAVNFEALIHAAVLMGQAHVVKHRACIKQFGIEFQSSAFARQSSPMIDAARMMKEQRGLGVSYQFRYFASELAVRNSEFWKMNIPCQIEIHRTSPA
jgi:hypothetical protein